MSFSNINNEERTINKTEDPTSVIVLGVIASTCEVLSQSGFNSDTKSSWLGTKRC
ncbi:Hypothetical protein FKW44_013959 [Caligus rogercresseyi]|uniref:Uncharacterized protein n=1 Tax=Caligus rogercresseyi TaxID=217165 RepID=A0A7T8JYM6_CALRO|nr:Hypothetical protein FKW44_013959 [Caligus rogercresseyi]